MAGGTSIWASKEARTDPKEIFNLRLLYLLISVAWGGWFYGFDTGNIGGILTLPSFENAFGLNSLPAAEIDNRKVRFAFLSTLTKSDVDEITGNDCRNAGGWWLSRGSLRCPNLRLSWTEMVGLSVGIYICGWCCDADGGRL